MNSDILRGQKKQDNRIDDIATAVETAQADIAVLQNSIGGEAGNPIQCVIRRMAAQTIPSASFTLIEWDTEVSDNDTIWDISDPTKAYCVTSGPYLCSLSMGFESNGTGARRADILVTSGETTKIIASEAVPAATATQTVVSMAGLVSMTTGDYITCRVYQSSGSDLDIDTNTTNRLSIMASQGEKGDPGTSYLSSGQATDLTDTGDTSLHYHSADRARAVHTGTQTASTISDFASAAVTATASAYAPIAKGVTNGDTHDHNGGDGGQIAYASLSGTPTIPDQLSDLSDDATHRTVTDTEKSTWNGKQDALTPDTDYLTPGTAATTYAPVLGENDNYVTDAEKTKLSNLSGTNTGDQDLSGYALKTNVLEKDNTTAFTPDADYEPATKKYVDDTVSGAGGYTDEAAQDAVGGILTDSAEIDFTYDDDTPSITASLKSGSIDESKLDTSVNASLDLADSAIQSGDLPTFPSGDIVGTTDTQTLTGKTIDGSNNTVSVTDPGWTDISSFTNSWVNFGSGTTAAAYKKIGNQVFIKGYIKSGTIGQSAFTLPVGYRPTELYVIGTVSNNAIGRFDVQTSGNVVPQIGNNTYVSLNGASFWIDD